MRNVVGATTAVALTALFSGCAASAPDANPSPSESTSADSHIQDPASAAVADYLHAIALGNIAGAWDLLSAETQLTYNDSAETYARYAPSNETVTAAGAKSLVESTFVVTAGPEDAFQIVSARSGDLADAWVVRETDSGLRIDDPGLAPTGTRAFTWTNPDATAFDTTAPPTLYFQKFDNGDDVTGPPDEIVGFADGVEVAVRRDASSGAGANFVAEVPVGTATLTAVWAPDPESPLWQSSTVTLD